MALALSLDLDELRKLNAEPLIDGSFDDLLILHQRLIDALGARDHLFDLRGSSGHLMSVFTGDTVTLGGDLMPSVDPANGALIFNVPKKLNIQELFLQAYDGGVHIISAPIHNSGVILEKEISKDKRLSLVRFREG
jgi:hypothetical protein